MKTFTSTPKFQAVYAEVVKKLLPVSVLCFPKGTVAEFAASCAIFTVASVTAEAGVKTNSVDDSRLVAKVLEVIFQELGLTEIPPSFKPLLGEVNVELV